jgi:hypothetical protein
MCEVMQQLVRIEKSEKAKCYAAADFHLQMFYGQAALEAKRMQKFHGERCEECIQDSTREASMQDLTLDERAA